MGIRQKMLLPMIALAVVSVAVVLILGAVMFSNFVDNTISSEIDTLGNVLQEQFNNIKNQTVSVSSALADDQELIQAIEARDRSAMLARSQQLVAEGKMDFSSITDTSGMVLARSHEPSKYDDDISNQEGIISALSGKPLTTIEEGPVVLMSIRSSYPIYGQDGSLIGTVVAGRRLDNEHFVDEMQSLLGGEVTVFKGDTRISTTVLDANGDRAVGTQASANVVDTVLGSGQSYLGKAQVVGRDAFVKYLPITDANNDTIGMLFLGKYTDVKNAIVMDFILKSLAIALVILVIGAIAGLVMSKRTVQPIKDLVDVADKLAQGDVDVVVDVETKDEMHLLAEAFRKIVEANQEQARVIGAIADGDLSLYVKTRSQQDVVGRALDTMLHMNNEVYYRIIEAANMVSLEAAQVSNGAQQLAQNNTEQAASVEQFSHAVAEIADKTRQSAEVADKAATLGEDIRAKAEEGSKQMGLMMDAVHDINEASQSINKVIKVIDDIAFQTNILALNAAVEAARAGQHGKGFAVVADEVRNLAAKSAEAASDTGVLIANSMDKAQFGSQIAEETARSLHEIIDGITESSALVNRIAEFSGQQTIAIESVNQNVSQVSQVVQDTSALAEETAASSEQLSSQSTLLTHLVSRFKLRNGEDRQFEQPQLHKAIEIDFEDEPEMNEGLDYDLL